MKYIIVGNNNKNGVYVSALDKDRYPCCTFQHHSQPIIMRLNQSRRCLNLIKSNINKCYLPRIYEIIPYTEKNN